MRWVTENWFWIVVFFAFVALHVFGHGGGHGGHGGGGRDEDEHRGHRPSGRDDEKRSAGHQH